MYENLNTTEHFKNLIKKYGRPLLIQVLPQRSKEKSGTGIKDPLSEEKYSPLPCLIHRYEDRVLLLTTGVCFSYCRFCTRKRNWKKDLNFKENFQKIINYIKKREYIKEVILSGGDPLTLDDSYLSYILSKIRDIPSIKVTRLATRALTYNPSRITENLIKILSKTFPLYLMTHFNHPAEISDLAVKKAKDLCKRGIILLNQTVLLKGINDSEKILTELSYRLLSAGIKPYALHLLDEVEGVSHFKVSAQKGKSIIKKMRLSKTGIGIPHLIKDLTYGKGKRLVSY